MLPRASFIKPQQQFVFENIPYKRFDPTLARISTHINIYIYIYFFFWGGDTVVQDKVFSLKHIPTD